MATLKCKMCGGDLTIEDNATVCECEYCGSKQTVPKVDDEKKVKLYERANRFRMANEFDKAANVYESIIEEDDTEAEAYWGLMLCKYGIEYVDDPATGDKIPTCHRSSFDSFMEDEDFEMVMSNSDSIARSVYREQAKQIEEIRRGIIEVSGKEEPYDIFICYKETDENGDRTLDSVLAQDVYDALTDKGYRVFFSRISLEDKLGTEYEPYIFAALNSAKVMLAFGTTYDYYNAVWVKNEWSRFLKIMAKDKGKYLIPCFKDIDAYDMPKEFAKLQSQDMGKVGAIQDLLRGIDKILRPQDSITDNTAIVKNTNNSLDAETIKNVIASAVSANSNNIDALLQRGKIALEDKEWDRADSFFEDALNINASCAEAYIGKLLINSKCRNIEELQSFYLLQYKDFISTPVAACKKNDKLINEISDKYTVIKYLSKYDIIKMFDYNIYLNSTLKDKITKKDIIISSILNDKLFIRANQFALGNTKKLIDSMLESIELSINNDIKETENSEKKALDVIKNNYEDFIYKTIEDVKKLYEISIIKLESDYANYVNNINNASSVNDYERIINDFKKIIGYKDVNDYINKCKTKIAEIENTKKIAKEKQKIKKRRKRNIICGVISTIIILILVVIFLAINIFIPKYAQKQYKNGKYIDAIKILVDLNEFKNSKKDIENIIKNTTDTMFEEETPINEKDYNYIIKVIKDMEINDENISEKLEYLYAINLYEESRFTEAIDILENLNFNSKDLIIAKCEINLSIANENYNAAMMDIDKIEDETERTKMVQDCMNIWIEKKKNVLYLYPYAMKYNIELTDEFKYELAVAYLEDSNPKMALEIYETIENYKTDEFTKLKYDTAIKLMKDKKISLAMILFDSIEGYNSDKIEKYKNLIQELSQYEGFWKYYSYNIENYRVMQFEFGIGEDYSYWISPSDIHHNISDKKFVTSDNYTVDFENMVYIYKSPYSNSESIDHIEKL